MTKESIEDGSGTRLGRGTTIQVWLALIIAVFICGWVVKDQVWKTRIEMRLTGIEDNLGDRWSRTQMTMWATEFKRLNPDLDIPSPFSVPKLFAEEH